MPRESCWLEVGLWDVSVSFGSATGKATGKAARVVAGGWLESGEVLVGCWWCSLQVVGVRLVVVPSQSHLRGLVLGGVCLFVCLCSNAPPDHSLVASSDASTKFPVSKNVLVRKVQQVRNFQSVSMF